MFRTIGHSGAREGGPLEPFHFHSSIHPHCYPLRHTSSCRNPREQMESREQKAEMRYLERRPCYTA
ncbi:hypothetical protein CCUS01_00454 [Colletotrichum cuscutae]|uniref:Uncharacterized protein n=1 Tax=Colletotrichum cuscutae TaxID=1209917 RepID=A0AAI9Y5Y7_9PEZI|nr:hypothetical protein CCUS01_00454 [Colletotrichum cuscutae]